MDEGHHSGGIDLTRGPGPLLNVHILVNPLPHVTVLAFLVAHLEFRCACVDIHITSEAESPVPALHELREALP